METLDLNNDSGTTEMVPIDVRAQTKQEEKNVPLNKETMDSTPIADIMMEPMHSQDPRMAEVPQFAPPQVQAQAAQMQMQMPAQAMPSKNPMNLTDEQMEALFVGVVAMIAFSKPIQEKLASIIPQFIGDDGARSSAGLAITGAVAAAIYFFGRRFVIRN